MDRTPPSPNGHPAPPSRRPWPVSRLVVTAILVAGYYVSRDGLVAAAQDAWVRLAGLSLTRHAAAGWLVGGLLLALLAIWWRVLARDKRFHAPLLVTSILLMGDAGFGILENHHSALLSRLTGGLVSQYSPTLVTIFTTIAAELLLGRFYYGKWPHVASAYVSGISAGILIKSPELWPFVMCGLLSITSKYVLRLGGRHLWNPTNLGVTLMLFLAPRHVASLSVQAGNEVWAVVVIWLMGGMILYQLGRLHVPLAFVAAFIPLSLLRAGWTGHAVLTELAPVTSPMFQLYIFFMITDPKTTTKTWGRQVVVAVLVAVAETFFRLAFRDVHSLYHALFTVGPAANLVEILYDRTRKATPAGPAAAPPGEAGGAAA